MGGKKYYYFSFDSKEWMIVGIAVSVISLLLGCLTDGVNWIGLVSIILFLVGISAIIIPPVVRNGKEIKKAYSDGLLDKAISEAIDASKQKDNNLYVPKYMHYLREITQADKLNPIELNIDNQKFDNLFTMIGALSITNAPIFAWKDPEYSWFLIANYTATLRRRYCQGSNVFQLKNREDKEFHDYIGKGKEILEQIKNDNFNYETNVRFYIISRKEIKENKAMIEQMIAGHELFGIRLFLIDSAVFNEKNSSNVEIRDLYNALLKSSNISNDVFDVMIYKNAENQLMVKYPSDGQLKERMYSEISDNCAPFIKALAEKLYSDKNTIYPPNSMEKTKIDIDDFQIDLNRNYTFINV